MTETEANAGPGRQFKMTCRRCERPVIVALDWVGREVRCPHCDSVVRVPPPRPDEQPARSQMPSLVPRRNFNFPCGRCGTLLETSTGLSDQPGQCPTCGVHLIVPRLDPYTGRPLPAQILDTELQAPTPLHAYAASGTDAPKIVKRADGALAIRCPRCNANNAIDANACAACGSPFTLEAAATVTGIRYDGRALAAIIVAVIALLLSFTPLAVLPAAISIVLGLLAVRDALGANRRPILAIVALALDIIALGIMTVLYLL